MLVTLPPVIMFMSIFDCFTKFRGVCGGERKKAQLESFHQIVTSFWQLSHFDIRQYAMLFEIVPCIG